MPMLAPLKWRLYCFGVAAVCSLVVTKGLVAAEPVPPIPLVGHMAGITDIACSLDGQYLVSASEDGTARIWSLQTLEPVRALEHSGPLTHVALAGSERVVTLTTSDADVEQGLRQRVRRVGKQAECAVWHIQTGERIHSLDACAANGAGAVVDCVTSADGKLFALAMLTEGVSGSREVALFDVVSAQRLFHAQFLYDSWYQTHRVPGEGQFPSTIGFLDGGRSLAFVGEEGGKRCEETIVVVDCNARRATQSLRCSGPLVRLATLPREPLVAAVVVPGGSQRGTIQELGRAIQVWRVANGQGVVQTGTMAGSVVLLGFSGSHQIGFKLVRSNDRPGVTAFRGCAFMDMRTGRVAPLCFTQGTPTGNWGSQWITAFATSSKGNYAAFGVGDRNAVVLLRMRSEYGLPQATPLSILRFESEQHSACTAFCFSPDERYLIAACHPRNLVIRGRPNAERLTYWKDKLLVAWKIPDLSQVDPFSTEGR